MMNFYVDLLPGDNCKNALVNLKTNKPEARFTANLYVQELPSLNVNPGLYFKAEEVIKEIVTLRENGFGVNIMMDSFCFGNAQFDPVFNKKLFCVLDKVITVGIDYITIADFFYFQCLKQKYPGIKIITSEYAEINNIGKIHEYLEEFGTNGVKLDNRLIKNRNLMAEIAKRFSPDAIHVNLNFGEIQGNIFRDSLKNNVSHYLQKGQWKKAAELIIKCKNEFTDFNRKLIRLNRGDFDYLRLSGFSNFWIYCNSYNEEEYLESLAELVEGRIDKTRLYPWFVTG